MSIGGANSTYRSIHLITLSRSVTYPFYSAGATGSARPVSRLRSAANAMR